MIEQEAIEKARSYFLTEDNIYGCAETALVVLQEAFDLPDATDSSPAMALNGGLAWRGELCGVLSGAALVAGRLAARRIADHKEAKRIARGIVAQLVTQFQAEYGSIRCRDLVIRGGFASGDIHTDKGHTAFIESGIWRDVCMRQIEFVICQLLPLQDEQAW